MKKIVVFLLLAVFGFGLIGLKNLSAQTNYGFTVKWDPSNCNCGTLTYILVSYYIDYEDGNCTFGLGSQIVTNTSSVELFVDGYDDECFIVDCPHCYTLYATVTYFDSSGACCTGTNNAIQGGSELNNKEGEVLVELN